MNSFLREFMRRRDADDVVVNAKNTVSYAPTPKSMSLPKPEGGLDHLIETKASIKEVHKYFKGQVATHNESPAALRAEIKRRFKGEPPKS